MLQNTAWAASLVVIYETFYRMPSGGGEILQPTF